MWKSTFVRNVTYLERNGKVAEKSLTTNVSLVSYLPGLTLRRASLICEALKMPVTAHCLEGLPVLLALQSLDWC